MLMYALKCVLHLEILGVYFMLLCLCIYIFCLCNNQYLICNVVYLHEFSIFEWWLIFVAYSWLCTLISKHVDVKNLKYSYKCWINLHYGNGDLFFFNWKSLIFFLECSHYSNLTISSYFQSLIVKMSRREC